MSVSVALGTSRTKVPVLFCRCQQFTLVWMPPGPSADAETAAGLCPTPTELQEMLSRKKGCVGRRGVGEVVGGWGSSQNLGGPLRSWARGCTCELSLQTPWLSELTPPGPSPCRALMGDEKGEALGPRPRGL